MKLKIKILIARFKQSKFLIFFLGMIIGATSTFNYIEGKKTYEYIQGGLPYTKSIIINAEASKSQDMGKLVSTDLYLDSTAQTDNSVESSEGSQSVDELADYIWLHESSRGKNNYSKCTAIGKINGVGYSIYGGKWMCFESHEEEMQTVKKWIENERLKGLSDLELLCRYSGSNYQICKS
jgi:hypothetical protein